jgi:hypothetical protein
MQLMYPDFTDPSDATEQQTSLTKALLPVPGGPETYMHPDLLLFVRVEMKA